MVGFSYFIKFMLIFIFFVPLEFINLKLIILIIIIGFFFLKGKIPNVFRVLRFYNVSMLISFVFMLYIGFLASQETRNIDTGGYHYPIVRWLVEFGVTPGIALLQLQYGYISSWYAFIALFEIEWLRGYVGAVGSFPLVLLLLHGLLSIFRVGAKEQKANLSDFFIVFSSFLIASLVILSPVYVGFSSISTDVPIASLIAFFTWLVLRDLELKIDKKQDSSIFILLVVVAASAFSIKLSSVPLVFFIIIYYRLRSVSFESKIIFLSVTIFLLFTLPTSVARFISSGYPFCPVPFNFLDVEWAYDKNLIAKANLEIRDFARWQWHTLPSPRYSSGWIDFSWIPYWVRFETLMAVYLLLCFISFYFLIVKKEKILLAISLLGVLGGIYVFISAPFLRLGIGFLIIVPSIVLSNMFLNERIIQGYFFVYSY